MCGVLLGQRDYPRGLNIYFVYVDDDVVFRMEIVYFTASKYISSLYDRCVAPEWK